MRSWSTALVLLVCAGCATGGARARAPANAAADWCPEHGVPESRCTICHPELRAAAPQPPSGADFARIVDGGQDLPSLEPHIARGKLTVFDFYADWCGPCRTIDEHLFALLARRADLAYRKLNIVSWDSPLAKRWLAGVPSLPYLIVYGKDGREAARISGLHLDELDRVLGP